MSGFGDFSDIFGGLGASQPHDAEGRIKCADCGVGHPHVTDLRPWPPDQMTALRYCGECRLKRAAKLKKTA